MEVFERFTDRARRVLTLAQEEARLFNHSFIGTEHILLGLMSEGGGLGAQALESMGISPQAVRQKVEETIGASVSSPSGSPPFTPRAKKVLELSLREALQMNHSYIGTEHILLGLVREGEGVAATVLVSLGVDLLRVRQEVLRLMAGGHAARGDVSDQNVQAAPSHGLLPLAPCCPRCRASLGEAARFRSIAVQPDSEGGDPVCMDVVYCMVCGTTLHMFKTDGPSEVVPGGRD